MQVRGVGIDLIDQDFQAQRMRALDQCVKIGKVAENRVNRAIVAYVIPKIFHRRGEKGRQPDGINPQAGYIVQSRRYPGQIAYAVAVAVDKAARINLVDCRAAPPRPDIALRFSNGSILIHRGGTRLHLFARQAR